MNLDYFAALGNSAQEQAQDTGKQMTDLTAKIDIESRLRQAFLTWLL